MFTCLILKHCLVYTLLAVPQEYLLTVMSIGLYHVNSISKYSYVVTFQKQLAGQGPVEDDPMIRLLGINV